MVLAAGKGTRMRSERPKVLHEVLGKPMIVRLLESLWKIERLQLVIVLGHEHRAVARTVSRAFPRRRPRIVLQREQRGTGHAVATALAELPRGPRRVAVVNGDLPLLSGSTLEGVVEAHGAARAAVTVGTMEMADPTGYGRILRDGEGRVTEVVEQSDCTPRQRRIREVNAGLYCFSRAFLERAVPLLSSANAQGELYLTDLVALAAREGSAVAGVPVPPEELTGINDRAELARVERSLLERVRDGHMRAGVTLRMPETTWIDESVTLERDVVVGPGCMLHGTTVVETGAVVEAGCVIRDGRVGPGARIRPYSVLEEAVVRRDAVVGPFARLRPGSDVGPDARVGNFVELKKTALGAGSKANHLSYLGDGEVGEDVNIGAGTIFCNYDGFSKHRTVIGDGVFVGSDSQMVAPVEIGRGSYVGSGSTITSDVPPDSLALARARQVVKEGRARALRALLEGRARAAKRPPGGRDGGRRS
jgi:bifunctional UDP-N-acetylglucosamine pyrophosphorylase/glucosamine-1-phosphate N-acetyltransferase